MSCRWRSAKFIEPSRVANLSRLFPDLVFDAFSTQRQPGRADARDAAAIDDARIVHSASFRQLQDKTQILNLGESDIYHNRLTHSIEVAQVAGGIAHQLKGFRHPQGAPWIPDRIMIRAVGATHDFGHVRIGHGGEVALHYGMPDRDGFEGQGQTLQILIRLKSFSDSSGANPSRRTLLGILKYLALMSAVCSCEEALVPRLLF